MRHTPKKSTPELLWSVRTLARRIETASKAYRSVYERLTSTTAPIASDRVKTSYTGNREDALLIAGERLQELREEYNRVLQETTAIIADLEDTRFQDILTNRYIIGMSPSASARAMHYSIDWERALHRSALEAFEKAYLVRNGLLH